LPCHIIARQKAEHDSQKDHDAQPFQRAQITDSELLVVLLIFLIEAQHLLAVIIAAALANTMGELRLAAVAARHKVWQRQLIVIAARAFARF
jgi:hypothetical protein